MHGWLRVELQRSARVTWRGIRLAGAAVVTVLVALAAAACSSSSDITGGTLAITGSSTIAPLVVEIAQRYEREHAGVRIDVQSGGSSRGIADLRGGLADIGMVSRALDGEEQTLHAYPIARDGVGLIVNARNPVAALSDAEVVAVYRGGIRSWAELGGRDAPIVVVHKAEGRATLEVFLAHFGLDNREVQADVIAGENEQAIKTVAGNPDAIGYVSIGTAEVDIEHGVPIRLLAAGGAAATLANVRIGTYPIARPLNLVTREPAQGLARAFIDYARSPAATAVFEAQSFVQVGE
jgi:phosphate transport system substrate-binding protein